MSVKKLSISQFNDGSYLVEPYLPGYSDIMKQYQGRYFRQDSTQGWRFSSNVDYQTLYNIVEEINNGNIAPQTIQAQMIINGGDSGISLWKYGDGLAITGNKTYEYRDLFKEKGFRFNKNLVINRTKTAGWLVNGGKSDEATQLITELNSGSSETVSNITVYQSAEGDRQRIIYNVEYPHINQRVKIHYKNNANIIVKTVPLTIKAVDQNGDIIDIIKLSNGSFARVVCGNWEIAEEQQRHELEFI